MIITQIGLDGIEREFDDGSPEPIVLSVLPVAFRTVLAAMPPPPSSPPEVLDAEDAITAAVKQMAKPFRISWEYSVVIKRSDLIALGPELGWGVAVIDAVLTQAAALPDSGAVYGLAP